jgi:dGTPase
MISERGLERTICDYIAGMTDRYAVEEYQKLYDPATLP